MYIPAAHYTTTPFPRHKLPLIVNVHGSLRRAERCRDTLIPLADTHGAAILAPLFPVGIDDPNDTQNYKFLRYRNIRYDLILLSMIDEVSVRWPGVETDKFYLAGYSGGGQFAARFFLLYPGRLLGVSIGAPGTVTRLDRRLKWPEGLGGVEEQFYGVSVDVEDLKFVRKVQLVVGEDDVHPPGDGLWKWVAEQRSKLKVNDRKVNESMVRSLPIRTEALARLRDELLAVGVEVQYDIVPGAGHDGQKVFPTVVEFLRKAIST